MYVRNAIQGPADETRSAGSGPSHGRRFSAVRPKGTPRMLPVLIALFLGLQAVVMTWLFRLRSAEERALPAAEKIEERR